MILSERFDRALAYATDLHRQQRRKGTDIPYVAHLLSVAALVLEHGGSEDQAIAALLHDAVEDQGGDEPAARLEEIRRAFGDAVANIVADCTDAWEEPKPAWRARKEAYIASLRAKDEASLLVSLADKTHNARAIEADHREIGAALWDRFKGGRDGTVWYYESLVAQFAEVLPGRLAEELRGAVRGFAGADVDESGDVINRGSVVASSSA